MTSATSLLQPLDASAGASTAAATLPHPSAQYVEIGDAAAGTGTSYTIGIGDRFDGTISSTSDTDWVRVSLTAGQSYVFSVWGTGLAAGLDDSVLTLYNASGAQIAFNDDVFAAGGNYFSQIEFTAATSGTYYLGVAGYGGATGSYRLQTSTNVYTLDEVVTQLTEFGWGFPTAIAHDEQAGDTMLVNISALTAAGQQLAQWALEAWSVATGITFLTTTSTAADILFDDSQPGAFAGPDSFNAAGQITQASVNISTNWLASYGTTIDSYSFLTYLHEIGHALGLYHAGPYDGSGSWATDAVFLNDSYQMTVMSYFNQVENTFINADFALPITPMVADVAAMDFLYGGTTSAHAGDTVWGAGSNVGGYLGTIFSYIFDGVAANPAIYGGGPVALTIQDSGGTDTIDLSTLSTGNRIDLGQEAVSDVAGLIGNLVIARGTVIENVIGGSGNDEIIGNAVANDLSGGSGNDTLTGGDGDDLLNGGSGGDVLDGGAGIDTVSYEGAIGLLRADLMFPSVNT
ncbi:M10 family metallopeptidase C-terminal domain-containing protein, partial [Albidovulum sp.]